MDIKEDHFSTNGETSRLIGEQDLTSSDGDEGNRGSSRVTDYETALEATGNGSFHYWLLFICGMANASDAIEILVVSFLLPSAECDFRLTSHDKGLISIMLFLGMMIGGLVWGVVGDHYGRRNTLIVSLCVNAIFAILSAFMRDFAWFLALRFLSGLGVGGSIPLIWAYFAELQPKSRRGAMLSGVASFWMVGNVMVAILAYAMIPLWTIGSLSSWRIFTVVCALPSLIVAVSFLRWPESPKFLVSKGKPQAALQILKTIHTQNNKNSGQDYQITHLEDERVYEPRNRAMKIKNAIKNCLELFRPPILKYTFILVSINFLVQFGYYGLWLWFPEIFSRLVEYQKRHPLTTAQICEMASYDIGTKNQTSPWEHCNGPVDTWVFKQSIILALASIPTNLWTIFQMDTLGRKFFLVVGMVIAALTVLCITLVTSTTFNLVLSCIFGAAMTMTFNALDCLSTELFPTLLRSSGIAVTLIFARLGAIVGNGAFGMLIDLHCSIAIITIIIMLIVAALLGALLPNTTRQELQ